MDGSRPAVSRIPRAASWGPGLHLRHWRILAIVLAAIGVAILVWALIFGGYKHFRRHHGAQPRATAQLVIVGQPVSVSRW